MMKNPTPIYSGNMMIEIGKVKNNDTNLVILDNPNNLKQILERKLNVSVNIPNRTNNLLVIAANNSNKKTIKQSLLDSKNFILNRHKNKIKLYDTYIMTKQIGEITIDNTPINTPKKKLIVTATFVTAFILSIFIVFFLDFISTLKNKKEDEN